jgi:hypothetical protein
MKFDIRVNPEETFDSIVFTKIINDENPISAPIADSLVYGKPSGPALEKGNQSLPHLGFRGNAATNPG